MVKKTLLTVFIFLTLILTTASAVSVRAALDSGGGSTTWTTANFVFYVHKDLNSSITKVSAFLECRTGQTTGASNCPKTQNYLEYPLIKSKNPTSSFPYYIYKATATRTTSASSTGWIAKLYKGTRTGIVYTQDIYVSDGGTTYATFGKTGAGSAAKPTGAPTESPVVLPTTTPPAADEKGGPFTAGFYGDGIPPIGLDDTRCPAFADGTLSATYTSGILNGVPCSGALGRLEDALIIVKNVLQIFLLPLIGTLFLIMTILGGVLYITSRGNQQQLDRAKKTLTAAIVGLIIVVLSYTLIAIFAGAIGGTIV